MKIKNENYITIQGWMRNELNLTGNDLLVYALIYSFSQTENQKFTGSLQYIADWCGATKQGIIKNLKNLIELGLIERKEKMVEGVNYVEYYSTMLNGVFNYVERGIQHSLTNNIDNNKTTNNQSISKDIDCSQNFHFGKSSDTKISTTEVDKFLELYNEHCFNLPKISKLTDNRIKAIKKILKKYSYEEIIIVLINANNSEFLKGNNDRGWKANIDFILREDKFVSILEGKYNTKTKASKKVSSDMGNEHKVMTAEQKKQFKEDIASGKAKKF